jgi:hypothetical protein
MGIRQLPLPEKGQRTYWMGLRVETPDAFCSRLLTEARAQIIDRARLHRASLKRPSYDSMGRAAAVIGITGRCGLFPGPGGQPLCSRARGDEVRVTGSEGSKLLEGPAVENRNEKSPGQHEQRAEEGHGQAVCGECSAHRINPDKERDR